MSQPFLWPILAVRFTPALLMGFLRTAISLDGSYDARDVSVYDLTPEAIMSAATICWRFATDAGHEIKAAINPDDYDLEEIGSDFYLSWSGSGVDFTDRTHLDRDLALRLLELSHSGEICLEFHTQEESMDFEV
jgi:hypothetical protein